MKSSRKQTATSERVLRLAVVDPLGDVIVILPGSWPDSPAGHRAIKQVMTNAYRDLEGDDDIIVSLAVYPEAQPISPITRQAKSASR